jgi:hypothetical protein
MSRARALAAPLAALLLCAAGLVWGLAEPPAPASAPVKEPPSASAEARALLGDLKVGDRLVGWTVEALDGPHDGVIRVDLRRDRVGFSLMVAKKGHMREPAPVETEAYSIYYGHVDPPDTRLPDGTIRATTNALGNRIRATEKDVSVPEM